MEIFNLAWLRLDLTSLFETTAANWTQLAELISRNYHSDAVF